jgi:uncharacterized membrane protein YdjX (TVP38/TMEM64 family)
MKRAAAILLLLIIILLIYFLVQNETVRSFFSHTNGVDELLSRLDDFRLYVRGLEPWSMLSFVFIQFLQVVIFILPGEIPQIAGGYLFGWFAGFLLSIAGIGIGSVFNFYVGRLWGKGILKLVSGEKGLDEAEKLFSSPRVMLIGFLLFLIPAIPKDAVCYIAGFSKIKLQQFVLFSSLGRLPGIIGSAIIGASAAQRNWLLSIILFSVSVLLFLLGMIFQKKLLTLMEKSVT